MVCTESKNTRKLVLHSEPRLSRNSSQLMDSSSTQPTNYNGTPEWVNIPDLYPVGYLTQISVGVNDVWAVRSDGGCFHYYPSFGFDLYVQPWYEAFSQITAGADGAWGLNGLSGVAGPTVRFDPNSQSAIVVPGNFSQISSGSGAGGWAVNSAGQVFTFVR
jgi:hypothetical protein